MPKMLTMAWLVAASSFSISMADDPRGAATDHDVALLKTSQLECLVGNNRSLVHDQGDHLAGYNGLFWLRSVHQPLSPFVPSYSGWNLEHYFDGRERPDGPVFFEPRYAEMNVRRVNERCVELHQPATATFGIESWTQFEVREPYYLDFTFRCRPHHQNFEGDFFGVFWASYLHGPLDKSLYFLDGNSNLDQPVWRQLCTQQHNRDSTVRHRDDALELRFRSVGDTLFSSYSPLRYSEPFFYGRFRNMVLIYVFRPNPHLRFTHSPSGGGRSRDGHDTNPAWDFQLVVPHPQTALEYSLVGRLVYKPWQGRADVLAEVQRYRDTNE